MGETDGAGRDKADQSEPHREGRNPAEWIVLIASAVVVAALIGAALYEHFAVREASGVRVSVQVQVDQAEVRDGVTYVPYEVRNRGAQPAQSVVVTFQLVAGEEVLEESAAEIAFLASGGVSTGEIVTTLDVTTVEIRATIGNIQLP